ncbi:MAG: hypothetical protein U1E27_11905 [Kiritimatiellia bacterium]|nr:hypothetical protein [Kiritimatiellia bacterium]
MKKLVLFSMIGLMILLSASAGEPVAQITFRVRDDAGAVVTGAVVQMNTFERWVPGGEFGKDIRRRVEGVTDTNGLVVLQIPSLRGSVKYGVYVKGKYFDNIMKMKVAGATYYRDMGGSFYFTNHIAGKWQPWDTFVDVEIKPVLNPIPMFARSFVNRRPRLQIPEYGKAIGFDLMKGDWVLPYGKGDMSDLIITLDCKMGDGITADGYQIYDASLKLSFSNDGDGILPIYIHPMKGSAFRLPRFADEVGYVSNWVKTAYTHEHESHYGNRDDENYFFRVRTKRDKYGVITNALYGKIQGILSFDYEKNISFTYYLNPTPNDRNMEFDPSRNLLTDLKPFEQVKEP